MRSLILALSLLFPVGAAMAETVVDVASGRFHVEVTQTQEHRFDITVTSTAEQAPMTPVNDPGLHLSCLLIPDLAAIDHHEIMQAAETGADRYCRAQFGADFAGSVLPASLRLGDGVHTAGGECLQLPY